MNTLSFIALILLSLVGYSGGAAGKAGKNVDLKPKIIDLVLVAVIWAGAIYSRITQDLDKWFLILIWLILSIILGIIAVSLRKLPEEKSPSQKALPKTPGNAFKKIWQSWNDFSKKDGKLSESNPSFSILFYTYFPFCVSS